MEGEDPRFGQLVEKGVIALIVVSVVVVTMESVPEMQARFGTLFARLELALVAVFLLEFALRALCHPRPKEYIFSVWGLIDLLSFLPAIVFLSPDLMALRTLRLFRLVRLFKLLRIGKAFDRLIAAFSGIRDELMVLLMVAIVALFLSAVGIYIFEREAQPENFGSIPSSLWWAIATLTTVGYGDVYPITTGGRIFTAFVVLIGLGLVATPAGLVASALTAEDDKDPESTSGDDSGENDNKEPEREGS
ncbi:MAG: ion transporter [Paracoccaceae bacterium]